MPLPHCRRFAALAIAALFLARNAAAEPARNGAEPNHSILRANLKKLPAS